LGRNLQGKVVSAPPGRARVKFLGHFLLGEGDMKGGSGGMVHLVVVACVLRATTKKVVIFLRKKCTHSRRENPGYAFHNRLKTHLFSN